MPSSVKSKYKPKYKPSFKHSARNATGQRGGLETLESGGLPPSSEHQRRTHRERIRVTWLSPRARFDDSPLLTRTQALGAVRRWMAANPLHPEAQSLIDLFDFQGEELAEAGVPYEAIKALARQRPFFD